MEPAQTSDGQPSGTNREKFPLPPGRSTGPALAGEIETLSKSAIVDGLLEAVHGLMAVLNENRQLLALNDSMLHAFGVKSMASILGLRLGEVVHCVHAEHAPGGCGTSEFCSTCGAAIAQVVALSANRANEQLCAIDIPGDEARNDLFFRVRASPLTIAGHRFILLFLQDVSQEQRGVALEQVFLHDLRNTTMGISMGTALLAESAAGTNHEIARDVLNLADRLAREIELQRCVAHSSVNDLATKPTTLNVTTLFEELHRCCRQHPAIGHRILEFAQPQTDETLRSDPVVLNRILYNMISNALEACPDGATVKVAARRTASHLVFSVWNKGYISPEIARRIFQRNFSTKGSLGHGLGTYSMKLLGEKLLGGQVSFTSTPEQGTCFTLALRG